MVPGPDYGFFDLVLEALAQGKFAWVNGKRVEGQDGAYRFVYWDEGWVFALDLVYYDLNCWGMCSAQCDLEN